jgi:hypothetical protein
MGFFTMPWQQRSKGKYYYRSRREGSRVKHDYYGTGPAAEMVASMDATERAERQSQADADAAMRKPFEKADGLLTRLITTSEELLSAVLLAEGFYCNQRTWKRRGWAHVRY